MGFMPREEAESIGFKHVGENVSVSSRAVFHNPSRISLGDHCRIDDFCLFSAGEGGISIGRYVHIGCFSSLIGAGPITMEDFSGLSGRVSIYSSNEDFSGSSLAVPTVDPRFRGFTSAPVRISRHVVVGAGSVILPNVTIGVGAAIGALSLVRQDCAEFGVYSGNPARRVSYRLKTVLDLESEIERGYEP